MNLLASTLALIALFQWGSPALAAQITSEELSLAGCPIPLARPDMPLKDDQFGLRANLGGTVITHPAMVIAKNRKQWGWHLLSALLARTAVADLDAGSIFLREPGTERDHQVLSFITLPDRRVFAQLVEEGDEFHLLWERDGHIRYPIGKIFYIEIGKRDETGAFSADGIAHSQIKARYGLHPSFFVVPVTSICYDRKYLTPKSWHPLTAIQTRESLPAQMRDRVEVLEELPGASERRAENEVDMAFYRTLKKGEVQPSEAFSLVLAERSSRPRIEDWNGAWIHVGARYLGPADMLSEPEMQKYVEASGYFTH